MLESPDGTWTVAKVAKDARRLTARSCAPVAAAILAASLRVSSDAARDSARLTVCPPGLPSVPLGDCPTYADAHPDGELMRFSKRTTFLQRFLTTPRRQSKPGQCATGRRGCILNMFWAYVTVLFRDLPHGGCMRVVCAAEIRQQQGLGTTMVLLELQISAGKELLCFQPCGFLILARQF